MSFEPVSREVRFSNFDPVNQFPEDFVELDSVAWDSAKRFNLDSDLPEYVGRGTVSVWEDDSDNQMLRKTEKRNVRSQVGEKDFEDFSELEKAVMFGELGISPRVHAYEENDRGVKRDFIMNFLGDYTNFEEKSFDSVNELEPYAEATGYVLGVLNELGMVHGDIISSRTRSYSEQDQKFLGTPVINNLLVGGRSEDVKMIDPEVSRFSNEGESHRWDRASSSYDMIEKRSADPDKEAENVWTALISEALVSTRLGSLVEEDDITYFIEDENGVERRKTDFVSYLDEKSGHSVCEIVECIPRFEFVDNTDDYFEDDKTSRFAEEVQAITENYVQGFEDGKEYVSDIEWPNSNDVEEYLQFVRDSL